jgi:hypothetical protein
MGKVFRNGILLVACLGLILPAPLLAGPPARSAPRPVFQDVQLGQGGLFWGQIVNVDGKPLHSVSVTIRHGNREVIASTNRSGYFIAKGFQTGLCTVHAQGTRSTYQLWETGTAPPKSKSGVLLVLGNAPVRSQNGPVGYWLQNKWVVMGIVAVAVAVPVALHNSRMDRD